MKYLILLAATVFCSQAATAQKLHIKFLNDNAVRIRYAFSETDSAKDYIYLPNSGEVKFKKSAKDGTEVYKTKEMQVFVNQQKKAVEIKDASGKTVFCADNHSIERNSNFDFETYTSKAEIKNKEDECIFGLGQFQDGYLNLRGLPRRLTQVNTQISIPMIVSNKGYGLLWNNYGLTDFNKPEKSVRLEKQSGEGSEETVNITTTEGGKTEKRRNNLFGGEIEVESDGNYAFLLDVGQSMARRHNLCIDGAEVIEMRNLWLPPTASAIVSLKKGRHRLTAELSDGDKPEVFFAKVSDKTVFSSPVSQGADYTVFVGSPEKVVSTFRKVSGNTPMLPQWAFGYIHCRERFHSQNEILENANRFRSEKLPADVIVQDWQYWGSNGWNSMTFDSANYPNPRLLTDSLHRMNFRLMLSVWSKIDKNSLVGKEMAQKGFYIPQTDWIDFFNPEAAAEYWKNFSSQLLPLGIDAWWQDATEPENDDLRGRMVGNGKIHGDECRNLYPLLVNKTVFEGLSEDAPNQRAMILTRCGFPGIQRYSSAMWSGDVGNNWETLKRQITAGLGIQAAGMPWWTYDAGGFFRPANQYSDEDYKQRMMRWIQLSVYLPLMRVHGYMSDTEPWHYGKNIQDLIDISLTERYRLLPYIYSNAAEVSFSGSVMMRPLVFDFGNDSEAMKEKYEFMCGKSLLVCPVTEPNVEQMDVYLPENEGGWFDFRTKAKLRGGQNTSVKISEAAIPVFAKGGSIVPYSEPKQFAAQKSAEPLEIIVFPGADAKFTLYEDDGTSLDYQKGGFSKITFTWNENAKRLTISKREGSFGTDEARKFKISVVGKDSRTVDYGGKRIIIDF